MKTEELIYRAFLAFGALWLVAYPAIKVLAMAIEGTLPGQ